MRLSRRIATIASSWTTESGEASEMVMLSLLTGSPIILTIKLTVAVPEFTPCTVPRAPFTESTAELLDRSYTKRTININLKLKAQKLL